MSDEYQLRKDIDKLINDVYDLDSGMLKLATLEDLQKLVDLVNESSNLSEITTLETNVSNLDGEVDALEEVTSALSDTVLQILSPVSHKVSTYDTTNLSTCDVEFHRQLNVVTCIYHLSTVTFSNKADHTVTNDIPSEYIPKQTVYQDICTYGGQKLDGLLSINSDGVMKIRMGTANTSMNVYGSFNYIIGAEYILFENAEEVSIDSPYSSGDHSTEYDELDLILPTRCELSFDYKGIGGSRFNLCNNSGITTNPQYSLFFECGTNGMLNYGYRTTSTSSTATELTNDGNYHHYKIVRDDTTITYYIDDVVVGTVEDIDWIDNYQYTLCFSYWRKGIMSVKNVVLKEK